MVTTVSWNGLPRLAWAHLILGAKQSCEALLNTWLWGHEGIPGLLQARQWEDVSAQLFPRRHHQEEGFIPHFFYLKGSPRSSGLHSLPLLATSALRGRFRLWEFRGNCDWSRVLQRNLFGGLGNQGWLSRSQPTSLNHSIVLAVSRGPHKSAVNLTAVSTTTKVIWLFLNNYLN